MAAHRRETFELRQQKETAQLRVEETQRQAEAAHRRDTADYLKIIADTIEGMRERFQKEQIPHDFGHIFNGLLDTATYEDFLQPYLGDETQHELDKLRHRVQEQAEIVDGELRSGRTPELLSDVLVDMQRVEGDVRALAARISPSEYARKSAAD